MNTDKDEKLKLSPVPARSPISPRAEENLKAILETETGDLECVRIFWTELDTKEPLSGKSLKKEYICVLSDSAPPSVIDSSSGNILSIPGREGSDHVICSRIIDIVSNYP